PVVDHAAVGAVAGPGGGVAVLEGQGGGGGVGVDQVVQDAVAAPVRQVLGVEVVRDAGVSGGARSEQHPTRMHHFCANVAFMRVHDVMVPATPTEVRNLQH